MKQSKKLAAEEQTKVSSLRPAVVSDPESPTIQSVDGVFRILELQLLNDYVAVAPFAAEETSAGGIVLTGSSKHPQDVGIVVGVGPTAPQDLVGSVVKFNTKMPVCDLTGTFEFYGKAKITVVKAVSVFAIMPPVVFSLVEDDE